DVIVVGAGQAGLATSYHLQQARLEHLVLERGATVAPVWRTERWDSFTAVTPNWSLKLPGMPPAGLDPDGFLPRRELSSLFSRYAMHHALPVRLHTPVASVVPTPGGAYRVTTPEQVFLSRSVVIATGYEQRPRIPAVSTRLPADVAQLHSSHYRNPRNLPAGAVLVVGSGQSGAQIAEELYQHGRRTFLATSGAGRVPRRYRGRDIVEWLVLTGFFGITPESLPVPKVQFVAPHVSGRDGGRSLNLHQFARDGVTLLGRVQDADGAVLMIAPDLHDNLAGSDQFEVQTLRMIDAYVQSTGTDAPAEAVAQLRDGFAQAAVTRLDLRAEGITSVIWATGFHHDYQIVHAPVFAPDGFPVQERGVTAHPGLVFVGMPWMPSLQTGNLIGVAEAAAHVANVIAARHAGRRALPRVLDARFV
ncbi:MAG: NAD(P)-binding domain-containing protein, partial [Thermomicrobiales bacterium]|nr:NAD(P)-binding domain-containing protein [Thermomicrobiales bacterium]